MKKTVLFSVIVFLFCTSFWWLFTRTPTVQTEEPEIFYVQVEPAVPLLKQQARLKGTLTSHGWRKSSEVGFLYSPNSTNLRKGVEEVFELPLPIETGKHEQILTPTVNEQIYYRMYAVNRHGTSYGDVKTVKALSLPKDSLKTYHFFHTIGYKEGAKGNRFYTNKEQALLAYSGWLNSGQEVPRMFGTVCNAEKLTVGYQLYIHKMDNACYQLGDGFYIVGFFPPIHLVTVKDSKILNVELL